MRLILFIILVFVAIPESNCQCSCTLCDSISIKRIKNNWSKVKSIFVPPDLSKYELIIEDFTSHQLYNNGKIEYERCLRKQRDEKVSDTCDLVAKNFYPDGWSHVKWIQNFYDGEKKIVNVDSIKYLSKEEYPYVLMFYFEFTWIEGNSDTGRFGFYIWDRRNNFKYNLMCALGRKDEVWFFKNLNK